jgi:hypothetical protein
MSVPAPKVIGHETNRGVAPTARPRFGGPIDEVLEIVHWRPPRRLALTMECAHDGDPGPSERHVDRGTIAVNMDDLGVPALEKFAQATRARQIAAATRRQDGNR